MMSGGAISMAPRVAAAALCFSLLPARGFGTQSLDTGPAVMDFTGRPFQVLLTGFGAFLNVTHNPTEAIVRHLGAAGCDDVDILPEPAEGPEVLARPLGSGPFAPAVRLRICWHAHVLPVNRSGALWTSQHLASFERLPYDAVFHTGLEDFAKGLKLEVAAANIQADDTGAPGRSPAVAGALSLLPTTVNVGWMRLKNLKIVSRPRGRLSRELELWSRDPGSYYCNEVYFRTLQFVRSRPAVGSSGALLPVMFVHVQNESASSVREDVDSLRQIVAHALWATYLAPRIFSGGELPGTATAASPTLPSAALLPRVGEGDALNLAAFGCACAVCGALLSAAIGGICRRRPCGCSLRVPLIRDGP
mmetsp:Transcript_137618/g.439695  ORF Transcript_137618/g.439695 Transcript_137618/m.439695 type:complete len:362 (+) Transcript_137618:61-1146(+)